MYGETPEWTFWAVLGFLAFAREGFAAALGAGRCRAAFRPKPETVGLLLDPAHAAEATVERKDATDGLGLGRVDDERTLACVIA
jgi:hypothetical protein